MSNGTIIICGSGGTPVVDKTIEVYDAPFSVAIKIDKTALAAQAVAAGMDQQKAMREVAKFVLRVEKDWWSWGEYLEKKLCIEYTRHQPHPQNFP